ncbi:rhodanese-like domain-containing protein [Clostridium oryzae]|uniref:Inner membrane protein YgaP n=1 Tax=Clostridium oryzae TaxID=1450648 RepID=A0A1V4ISU5_9CLOT|nr:rhodanese-like domain-containing protein [Clostridium oryzae]OPJ63082.1 inner membrane protein YgaP [Clostridium oryzae]
MLSFLERNKYKSVKANDMENLLGKVDLIDIRDSNEYANGHIPTAKNIPMEKLLGNTAEWLDKNKQYYIVCQTGGRSSKTCSKLFSEGYNVVNVEGGTGSYIKSLEMTENK